MPLFKRNGSNLILKRATNFKLERELQDLIEKNLETVFSCKFVASEFSTGSEHAGRIDTLAISEDNNPVIIEYKKNQSSGLLTQSLYYLHWLHDHQGDFQVITEKSLGKDLEIDWNFIRVICIAPNYSKFDLHAVKVMGANIELWQYRLYEDNVIYFEEVFRKSAGVTRVAAEDNKDPVMVAAGKKAAITRATGSYNFEEHDKKANEDIRGILSDLREYILSLDESVEEAPKKYYIAYKTTKNFVCIETRKKKLLLFLKLNPKKMSKPLPEGAKDVSGTGHFGTGDLQYTLASEQSLEEAKILIKASFDEIGG